MTLILKQEKYLLKKIIYIFEYDLTTMCFIIKPRDLISYVCLLASW
jgi:hypothetical protein